MKVRNLLATPENWTQYAYHRCSKEGVHSYCLLEAIYTAYAPGEKLDTVLRSVFSYLDAEDEQDIILWNDDGERTFKDIRKLIKHLDI